MENSDLVKEKFQTRLQEVNFKWSRWANFALYGIGGLLIALLLFLFSLWFFGWKLGFNLLITIIAVIIVVSIILASGFSLLSWKMAKKNQELVKKTVGIELHQIYFENLPNPFSNLVFKFEGVEASEVFKTHCLKFKLGLETITWQIDQNNEKRTKLNFFNKKSFYFLKFILSSSAKKLEGMKEITISKAKEKDFGNKKSFLFKSESMEFNQKYQVESSDEKELFQFFTPKIVENFVKSDLNLSEGEIIYLKDNLVQIKCHSRRYSSDYYPLVPDPLDFSGIYFNKKSKTMVDDLYNKVQLDFDRYFKIQKLLEPLELYN